ncbi:PREDICTED: histone-lysine N-methyltransferase SETMAR [Chrysochloris asiatica]|uniref:Histone-lysine N-methyltransferase SETMAR n=1 Tax=Chrysochloris asiatica TaxID=185453 RepID=A0A9B0WVG9_CHRAS|nr:PREDICTED: histone-lysine N-methyltransferase SETMAR [Chrysochloris asiatica]
MFLKIVKMQSLGLAVSKEEPEAQPEQQDVACGLENLPVSSWPPEVEPAPFQYTPDHVLGPGADIDPTEITFPGCTCLQTPCVPGTCSCLRHEENYDSHSCLRDVGSEGKYAQPVFECNALCQCSDRCKNRVVQRGLQFHLQVFKTDKKGWGLRTLEFIPKGSFVCEYAGEVLGFREVQRRIQSQTVHDSNYIIAIREHIHNGQVMETFVDPTHIGNIGRYLNHSCEPNLWMIPVRIHSMVPKLALFAAKDILPQAELSYDYSGRFLNQMDSDDGERLEHGKLRKPCYCGARSCAAFLPYDSTLYGPLNPNIIHSGDTVALPHCIR